MINREEKDRMAWQQYLMARRRWLEDTYRKKGTIGKEKIQAAIKQLHQYFEQLKTLAPKYRETFIPKFSEYIQKRIFMSDPKVSLFEASSQQSLVGNPFSEQQQKNFSQYMKMRYRNYLEIIKFLSANHLKFHYIARHLLVDDKPYLLFQMERGNSSIERRKSNKKSFRQNSNQEQEAIWNSEDPNLIWILLRDLAEAILQLEAVGVYHSDIEIHNILLFNCDNLQDLKDTAKLRKLLGKIRFKLIDFEDAFFIDCKRHEVQAQSFDEMIKFLRKNPAQAQSMQKDRLKTLYTDRCKDSMGPYETNFMRQSHAQSYKDIIKQKQSVLKKDEKDVRVDELLEMLKAEEVDYRRIIEYLTQIIDQIC